jgi:hypothetical protein
MRSILIFSILIIFIGCDRKEKDDNIDDFANYYQQEIRNTYTEKDFVDANNTWKSLSASPSDYAKSAYIIIHHMEIEKKRLTLGNVVDILGLPSYLSPIGYGFDESDNIAEESTRLQIVYDDKEIKIGFSVAGFVDAVLYKMSHEHWTGASSLSWPQKLSDLETFPIVTGNFDNISISNSLIISANKLIEKYKYESDWFSLIVGWSHERNLPISASQKPLCSAKTILVDGVGKDLAQVHYQIKGEHILYYDTWWSYKNKQWEMVSNEEAQSILINLKSGKKIVK